MNFQVMLAGKAPDDLSQLSFPLLASPKLDGIRAFVHKGVVYSRKGIAMPSKLVQQMHGRATFNGLDGELIAGSPTDPDCYRNTNSACMKVESNVPTTFYVFDFYQPPGTHPFSVRLGDAAQRVARNRFAVAHEHVMVRNVAELQALEEEYVSMGYEGIMLRDPAGPYKSGRSTTREGWLLKLKRFEDSEATILECVELSHNHNQLQRDATGKAKRSTAKAGKVAGGVLGAIVVRDIVSGVEFQIGAGFKMKERKELWEKRNKLVGRQVRYRFFPMGNKDKPRFPTFDGFREDL